MRHRANYPGTVTAVAPNGGEQQNPVGTGPTLTRRRFLGRSVSAGTGALAGSGLVKIGLPLTGAASAFLAACSQDPVAPTVVTLFSPDRVLASGRPQRIPFAIVSPDPGLDGPDVAVPADDGSVGVTISLDGDVVFEGDVRGRVVDHDHVGDPDPEHQHANLFRYYPLRATLPEPGIYDLELNIEGVTTALAVQLFDPAEVKAPLPGDPFPSITTPTVDRPGTVDRICTRFEQCSFHTISADEALAGGRAMAVLVATPAFCSTAYCGPVLETLIAQKAAAPDVEFIHVEVYENPDEVDGNFLDPAIRVAPAVAQLGLEFEPSLFLVDADGILVDRIDNVFDATELAEALRSLQA